MPPPSRLDVICENACDLSGLKVDSLQEMCRRIHALRNDVNTLTTVQLPILEHTVEQFHEKHLDTLLPNRNQSFSRSERSSVGALLSGIDSLFIQCKKTRGNTDTPAERLVKEKVSSKICFAVGYTPRYIKNQVPFYSNCVKSQIFSPLLDPEDEPGSLQLTKITDYHKPQLEKSTRAAVSTHSLKKQGHHEISASQNYKKSTTQPGVLAQTAETASKHVTKKTDNFSGFDGKKGANSNKLSSTEIFFSSETNATAFLKKDSIDKDAVAQNALGKEPSAPPAQNAFGQAPAATPAQNAFGKETSAPPAQNAFGQAPAATPAQNAFGQAPAAAPAQNAFWQVPAVTPAQNAFGQPQAPSLFGQGSNAVPPQNTTGFKSVFAGGSTGFAQAQTQGFSSVPTGAFSPQSSTFQRTSMSNIVNYYQPLTQTKSVFGA